jgi:hypothetical protein
MEYQPCVCIARCNHCICGALPPGDRDVLEIIIDELVAEGTLMWLMGRRHGKEFDFNRVIDHGFYVEDENDY